MSDELHEEIGAALGAILKGRATTGEFDASLWEDLAGTGFHLLGVPEEIGGSGGRLSDLAVVVDLLAFHGALVPVAESAFLAGWLLSRAGLTVPGGVVVASVDEASARRGDGVRLSGRVRAPWARHADHVVTTARDGEGTLVAVVPVTAVERSENLAGEPRDVLVLDDVAVLDAAPAGVGAEAARGRGALVRSVQLAGAARAVLESARRHVAEREQFGRPLARFQAVQQHLAALAGEVTAMRVAADAAVLAVEAGDRGADVAVAAAKATASAGAHVVAAIGHQLHGALGYSAEHHLGAATTRLWSWREEFGNEAYWQDRLAAAVAADGSWWSAVTGGAR